MPEDARERILVVGPAWVGDMVMAQSLYMALRERHPEAAIDVVAPAWSEPLLARMPEVARSIPLPAGHGELKLRTRLAIGRDLRGKGYVRAIVLPRSYKSALIPFRARIPRRTGYLGEMRYGILNDIRPLDKGVLTQTVQRYVALAGEPGEPLPPPVPRPRLRVDTANRDRLLEALRLQPDPPIIALMPGAEYGPAKRWPAESFAALARALHEAGYQAWIFGSQKDRPIGERIAELSRVPVTNLCGRTTLVDAADLISLAHAAVSNDSGLMHVAAALDRPLVAIYGSSSPGYTPPLSERAVIVSLGLECSPCFQRTCPRGDYACLEGISPESVLEQIGNISGPQAQP